MGAIFAEYPSAFVVMEFQRGTESYSNVTRLVAVEATSTQPPTSLVLPFLRNSLKFHCRISFPLNKVAVYHTRTSLMTIAFLIAQCVSVAQKTYPIPMARIV